MASEGDMEEVVLSMSKASIEVEVKEEGKKNIDRHCAFCLTLVKGAEVKTCSKCKRRAYCSKECQVADWKLSKDRPAFNGKIHGFGQGHKNWCGLPYGEEDLDWKVAPISGKGLGIVALRDLPPLYRIIVDGLQRLIFPDNVPVPGPYHPALDDLSPLDADAGTKLKTNAFESKESGVGIGLRVTRVNHNCEKNAELFDEHRFNVLILYADREIKAGEEICTSYVVTLLAALTSEYRHLYKPPEEVRQILFKKWGIVCPPSCICRDDRRSHLLKELVEIGEYCEKHFREVQVDKEMEKVIENAKEVGVGSVSLASIHLLASLYAGQGPQKNEALAKTYKEMGEMLGRAIYHPASMASMERTIDLFVKHFRAY